MKWFNRHKVTLTPTVTFLEVYKDVKINEEEDEIITESKIQNAKLEQNYKTIRWDDLDSIEGASLRTKDNLENKHLYYVTTFSGHKFTVILKEHGKFINTWNQALKEYDLLRH
ncbi:MAG TPA: hypothetical protein VJN02_07960 [Gammaproteobacteria bacterium]|nr:hypothetical protein [Gammaproteobacteria bacterium]